MTSSFDDSPEWRRQTRVERATSAPSDPDDAAYFRLYRTLEEPLPVDAPGDLAERVVRRRSRATLWRRFQWAVLALFAAALGLYGGALSLSSWSATDHAPMMRIPDVDWPLAVFAGLVVVAGVGWVERRRRPC